LRKTKKKITRIIRACRSGRCSKQMPSLRPPGGRLAWAPHFSGCSPFEPRRQLGLEALQGDSKEIETAIRVDVRPS